MAAVFRLGIFRIVNNNAANKLLSNTSDLKVPIRGIAGKALRCVESSPPKPAPWPYKTKRYTLLNYVYDKTTPRFDQNSKIIVVEGPIAAGKTKLAKELAEDLDMLYMPEANLDMMYVNDYGFNLKELDPQLPESCRSFDIKDFLNNPRHRLTATFQLKQYVVKYSQYIDALAHVFSTGQGVILDRCVYSDFVFMEAMFRQGFLSKGARSVYYDLRKNTLNELLRPHLVIYLHVPIDKVQEKIKQRNNSVEVKSSALTPAYLKVMEDKYKQNYLKDISVHSELLVYDWSDAAEVEVVVEDIERIDFTRYDKQDLKMKDWVYYLEEEWAVLRHTYADKKDNLMMNINIPRFDVPELITEAEDARIAREVIRNAPGMEYQYGYNPNMGDSGLLFKVGMRHRHTLPLIERKFP
ncbi:hypothetical protein ILUMI_19513 [Ignelater luminosus]|uniref:NADH dehydrogenase [ubiquinone] 1 alpha subcomplex subunit 10, mitochondrial n=1 Tax=Ignelater luminosus TaxID=2038154 RepID=A0A8K0CKD0_IGNLU|nr:hypothetical protein ILUMI_19513 [Ignelater luminosus]